MLTSTLTLREFWWGRIYTGDKTSLLVAGVVQDGEKFPGEIGQPRFTKLTRTPEGYKARIRKTAGHRFDVFVSFKTAKRRGQGREIDLSALLAAKQDTHFQSFFGFMREAS